MELVESLAHAAEGFLPRRPRFIRGGAIDDVQREGERATS
jgi:hypothetical protein